MLPDRYERIRAQLLAFQCTSARGPYAEHIVLLDLLVMNKTHLSF